MTRRLLLVALCAFACLTLPACVYKTKIVNSKLNISPGTQFSFSGATLAPAVLDTASRSKAAKMERHFDSWSAALTASFEEYASDYEIIAEDGQTIRATVTALDPGTRWMRFLWRSRKSWASATVWFDCGEAGSFTVTGTMKPRWFRGWSTGSLLQRVGRTAAKHLEKQN
ncbi:MAG: hypothetical protein AAF581_06875 [Planctomycetota bacterium]